MLHLQHFRPIFPQSKCKYLHLFRIRGVGHRLRATILVMPSLNELLKASANDPKSIIRSNCHGNMTDVHFIAMDNGLQEA